MIAFMDNKSKTSSPNVNSLSEIYDNNLYHYCIKIRD